MKTFLTYKTCHQKPLFAASLCAFLCSFLANAEYVETYTVTVKRPFFDETLNKIFPHFEYNKRNSPVSASANELLVQSPSVNINGQGGQIQNINIRGFSRWRVQSLIDGVPITSDRRAGASVSFVAPSLIERVSVLPGATSTYLGSGAIGGAVNVLFAENFTPHARFAFSENQRLSEYSYASVLEHENMGTTDWHLSYRTANNGTDANGNTLFDQFTQSSAFVRQRFDSGVLKEAWTLYSHNKDIGKSSSDFPESRITTYPKNTHWLGKLRFDINGLDTNVWWHKSTLDTHILRPGNRINTSQNEAFDVGIDTGKTLLYRNWSANWRIQGRARNGVIINEQEYSLFDQLTYDINTLDASEVNAAALFDVSRHFGRSAIAVGTRVDWQQQRNENDTVSSENISAFVGVNQELSTAWSASLYFSSAFRNPSLTERYFSGETPRGAVLGRRNLNTEKSFNIQASILYQYKDFSGTVELFHQTIDDYIERVDVSGGTGEVLQYSNVAKAEIDGVSYQFAWQPTNSKWDGRFSGAWIKGEDNAGIPIADIPANRHRVDVGVSIDEIRGFTVLTYRAAKSDAADGERRLDDVFTMDIGASWNWNSMRIEASIQNLSNQQYYVSPDDKAAFAQGRSVQFALTYLL